MDLRRVMGLRRLMGLALVLAMVSTVVSGFGRQALAIQATPTSTDPLAVEFAPGVVPTIFGDVAIPEKAERIITLTDGALDAVIALGLTPVGATRSSNAEGAAAYIAERIPESVTYVGGWSELDIELIVGLTPDIIISDRYMLPEDYEKLNQIAPVVATGEIEVAGPEALQQWEYETLVWAHALGKDAEAREQIDGLRARAATIKSELSAHNGETVVVFRPQPDFPVVMSHNWITGTVLTWAGFAGNDLTADMPPPHSGRDLSNEQLNLIDADWLFAAARDQEMRDTLAGYENNPIFQSLSAAQNERVFLVSGDLWSGATGVLAAHAMLDDVVRIVGGGGEATPAA